MDKQYFEDTFHLAFGTHKRLAYFSLINNNFFLFQLSANIHRQPILIGHWVLRQQSTLNLSLNIYCNAEVTLYLQSVCPQPFICLFMTFIFINILYLKNKFDPRCMAQQCCTNVCLIKSKKIIKDT